MFNFLDNVYDNLYFINSKLENLAGVIMFKEAKVNCLFMCLKLSGEGVTQFKFA